MIYRKGKNMGKVKMGKKRKQKLQRELLRKPKFGREFKRVVPIILVILFLIDWFFTLFAQQDYIKQCEKATQSRVDSMLNAVEKLNRRYEMKLDFTQVKLEGENVYANSNDENRNEAIENALGILGWKASCPDYRSDLAFGYTIAFWYHNLIEHDLLSYLDNQRYATVYFYNLNGDCLVKSDPGIYQVVTTPKETGEETTNKIDFYRLDTQQIKKAYPDIEDTLQHALDPKENKNHYMSLRFEDLYKRGEYVLPKTIVVLDEGKMNYNGEVLEEDIEGVEVSRMDLTECDFSGYELMDITDTIYNYWSPITIGYNLGKKHILDEPALAKEDIQKMLRAHAQGNKGLDIEMSDQSGYYWKATANDSLYLYVAYEYDFMEEWREILYGIYILSLLFGIFVAALLAGSRYQKKKVAYELYSYRKKTTDAMAHDLKSPLMAISGYAENLESQVTDEKAKEKARQIRESVKQMDEMIANILELSRLEESEMKLHLQKIDVGNLFDEELVKYQQPLADKEMTIEKNGSLLVTCDEKWMKHLIDNLLSNALKYGRENSQVIITFSKNSFSVQNDFDQDLKMDKKKLLEPFVKGEDSRSGVQGNGLGLSIANQIVMAHGWTMDIQTENYQFVVTIKG